MTRFLIRMVWLVAILAVATVAGWFGYGYYESANAPPSFKTTKLTRGDLSATISATGTLEPEEVVDVGAQVAGLIQQFGRDPRDKDLPLEKQRVVDFNTPVTPNTLLAEIDPKVYQAQVDQQDANVKNAQANIAQMEAKQVQAERDWKRAEVMANNRLAIADSDYDQYLASFETAKSNLGIGKAALKQAEAARDLAKINLDYTKIYSPVNGVIVDRRVNVGQTVVSSLTAPSLFLIAKDLSKIQIWASVNEADIGQIKKKQPVMFTVDAFPNETFKGTVFDVRLNATMTQQVVTYTVVVDYDNKDGRLLPYLTANLQFEVDKRLNALLVPNGALRWQPSPQQVHPDIRKTYLAGLQAKSQGLTTGKEDKDNAHVGTLWVQDSGFVRPIKVKVGLSDGAATEILGTAPKETAQLKDDMEIVTGIQAKSAGDTTTNPFQVNMFQKKQ